MKKSLLIFLFSIFLANNSFASSAAFILTQSERLAPVISKNGLSLLIPSTATSHLPTFGTASSGMISRRMIARVGTGGGIATVGLLAVGGFAAWVDAHPSDFPTAYRLLHPYANDVGAKQRYYVLNGRYYYPYAVGEHLKPTREPYISQWANYAANRTLLPCSTSYASGGYTVLVGTNGVYDEWKLAVSDTIPPLSPADQSNFEQAIAPNSNISVESRPDIDRYIRSNPDAVTIPTSLPQDVSDAAHNPQLTDTDSDGLPDIYDDDIDGDGIPDDQDVDSDGDGTDDGDQPVDPGQIPDRKSLNFSKWKELLELMAHVWPFTLLLSLSDLYSQFVATPVAPSFQLPVYGTIILTVDLSFFDPMARISRWVSGALLTISAIMLVVKWYRGVS